MELSTTKRDGSDWFRAPVTGVPVRRGSILATQDEKTIETRMLPLIRGVSSETVSP